MKLYKKFGSYLLNLIPAINFLILKKELTINVPLNKLRQILVFLKYHTNTQYKILSDICGVDYLTKVKRFEIVYNLLSIKYNTRIRLKIRVDEINLVESITTIYPNANWYEREIWDMFGLFFTGHPELRRILTDYGFEGYPLRKDFPVSGFVEVFYDETKKRVKYQPINLSQKNKSLKFQTPWT